MPTQQFAMLQAGAVRKAFAEKHRWLILTSAASMAFSALLARP
jgi:hypothetical protein